MKIAVFGIGGVGGFVGGMLARRYNDIYFYARGDNLKAVQENGLSVSSFRFGEFTVRPKLVTGDAAEIGLTDVLIISSKGYNLSEVCGAASPMIGPGTAVIPLLNGGSLSEMMGPLLPPCILADGLIRTHSHLSEPGHVVHETGGNVIFGMSDGSRPSVLAEAAELLCAADVPAVVSENILLDCWKKYVSMCGSSVAFCWFDAPTGGVVQTPGFEAVLRGIWGELVSVAAAKGIALPDDTVDDCIASFVKASPDTITSLYRDLRDGKPVAQTELFHLVGRIVLFGAEAGVPTPYHREVLDRYTS